jgi:hypothetical protein
MQLLPLKTWAVFNARRKNVRAYHATCAAAAGVQVDVGKVPVFSEDGTEYTDDGIDFRCRFHRIKRGSMSMVPLLKRTP